MVKAERPESLSKKGKISIGQLAKFNQMIRWDAYVGASDLQKLAGVCPNPELLDDGEFGRINIGVEQRVGGDGVFNFRSHHPDIFMKRIGFGESGGYYLIISGSFHSFPSISSDMMAIR